VIYDIAIIGAGIAGASVAAELDPRLSVVLIEAEDQPGYHATGRSVAFWEECYGGPDIQPLTSASGPFLARPDPSFAEASFLKPRGVLYIGEETDCTSLEAFYTQFTLQGVHLELLGQAAVAAKVPGLKPNWPLGVYGRDCSDIDVSALHQAYLRRASRSGVVMLLRSRVASIGQTGGIWSLAAGKKTIQSRLIVNAGGAWADHVATMAGVAPVGHQSYRRTVAQIRTIPAAPDALPLVIHHGGDFYFKPEPGGRIWLSPHDETPFDAGDVAAEEYDVALAIDRLAGVVNWDVNAVERRWAGLRSFAPDRLPVYGYDVANPGFFWCTGQGGFGIQTAPAAGKLCAGLIEGRTADPMVAGIDATRFAPRRFSN
jgi:D-arginine dehydrogenase